MTKGDGTVLGVPVTGKMLFIGGRCYNRGFIVDSYSTPLVDNKPTPIKVQVNQKPLKIEKPVWDEVFCTEEKLEQITFIPEGPIPGVTKNDADFSLTIEPTKADL